jgi:hypothetical protein
MRLSQWKCWCSLAAINRVNLKLLAANPGLIANGSAGVSGLRHVAANATWAIRSVPVPCEEASSIGVPCSSAEAAGGGSKKKRSFWKRAGGIVLILCFVLVAAAALGLGICICCKRCCYSVHAFPSADVSKSPSTVQMHEKAASADYSALWRADPPDHSKSDTNSAKQGMEEPVCPCPFEWLFLCRCLSVVHWHCADGSEASNTTGVALHKQGL